MRRIFPGGLVCVFLMISAVVGRAQEWAPSTLGTDTLNDRITQAQNLRRLSGVPFHGEDLIFSGPYTAGYVQNVLNRLIYVSPLRGYDIRAVIVNSRDHNAGTDGSRIFVNAGLLATLGADESLLAAVLAHELGHIIANHHGRRKSNTTSVIKSLSPLLGFTKWGSYAGLFLREGTRIQQLSYSRRDEIEADAIAAILTYEAGYDPYGLNRFFEASQAQNQKRIGIPSNIVVPVSPNPAAITQSLALTALRSSPFYKTHPPGADRRRMVDLIAQTKSNQISHAELSLLDPWGAYIYYVMETRRPKSRDALLAE